VIAFTVCRRIKLIRHFQNIVAQTAHFGYAARVFHDRTVSVVEIIMPTMESMPTAEIAIPTNG
jgi:hypothetical protein